MTPPARGARLAPEGEPISDQPDGTAPEPQEAPASPPDAAEPAPPGVWGRVTSWFSSAEEQWEFLGTKAARTRLYAKVVLVHLRYTFGYLAFGFLVSAPLTVGSMRRLGMDGIGKSLLLGALFALPCLLLWPFTIIDWGRMRIPEFKNLELALTRWAMYLAAGFLAITGLVSVIAPAVETFKHIEGWASWAVWLCDWRLAWLNLTLMFFAWLRVKFHTVLFREFYTLKPGDELVLLKFGGKDEEPEDEPEAPPDEDADSPTEAPVADPPAEPPGDEAQEPDSSDGYQLPKFD